MSDQTNSLSSLHETFNTSEKIIFQLVKDLGFSPMSRTKLVKGYDNEVYEISTKENIVLIFRIKHFGETSMEEENWVIQEYKKVNAPVPHVYKVGTFKENNEDKEYMIQRKISGTPLAEIKDQLTNEKLSQVYEKAGTILRQLHQARVDGFYKRHNDGVWDFPDWYKVANSAVIDRGKETTFYLKSGFMEDEVKKMLGFLEIYRDQFNCKQPVLCHGDYLEEHIFIDKDLTITGIIDFGMYRGDHPIHDFARLYSDSRFANMDSFKKGYGDHEMFHDRFEIRLLLEALGNQMGHLGYYAQSDMKHEINYTAKRLRETYNKLTEVLKEL